MENANKEAGIECLGVAKSALAAGDLGKAERFAAKAMRLYPHDEARQVQASVERAKSGAGASTSSRASPTPNGSSAGDAGGQQQRRGGAAGTAPAGGPTGMGAGGGLRNRPAPAAAAGTSRGRGDPPPDEDHKATPEQRQLVAHIRATTCYYAVLGLEKGANDEEVKRAYRQLALKLHPDRNKARGADEAFKAVSKAYSCLIDPEKRRSYDTFGHEGGAGAATAARRGAGGVGVPGGGFGGGGWEDIDPQDLFEMVFGRGFMMGAERRHVYRNQQYGRQQQQQQRPATHQERQTAQMHALLQFVPLLLLLAFTFLQGQTQPVYSMQRSRDYQAEFATASHQVPYFVRDAQEFHKQYAPGSRERVRLELEVEREYRDSLQQACYTERMVQQRYHYYGQKDRAKQMEMKACNELMQRFGTRTAKAH